LNQNAIVEALEDIQSDSDVRSIWDISNIYKSWLPDDQNRFFDSNKDEEAEEERVQELRPML
jgi:hypothetical protein